MHINIQYCLSDLPVSLNKDTGSFIPLIDEVNWSLVSNDLWYCYLHVAILVLSTSDGSSDTSQHHSSEDELSEQEQSPASENTPKRETAQESLSRIDAAEDAKKKIHDNSRSDEQPTLVESPTHSQGHNQHATRDEEDIPTSGNEHLVKKPSSIKSSRELNGYMHDESTEPAQGIYYIIYIILVLRASLSIKTK